MFTTFLSRNLQVAMLVSAQREAGEAAEAAARSIVKAALEDPRQFLGRQTRSTGENIRIYIYIYAIYSYEFRITFGVSKARQCDLRGGNVEVRDVTGVKHKSLEKGCKKGPSDVTDWLRRLWGEGNTT